MPPDFWERERERLLELLFPELAELARAGVEAAAEKIEAVAQAAAAGFNPTLSHRAAAAWARGRATELVELLDETTTKSVNSLLARWIETPGSQLGDLVEELTPILSGNVARAELIATTETTTAYAEGEAIVYREAGIPEPVFKPAAHPRCRCWTSVQRVQGKFVVVWQTNRDELVCEEPIQTPWGVVEGCKELHTMVISEGEWLGRKVASLG
jgi:hypothetical protein